MAEDQQIPAKRKYPPGYRFKPTDRELIQDYLEKKINKEPILAEINEVILKHINPIELPGKYPKLGDDEWYFLTPRDRKYPNGERPDRVSDTGYWKATGADKAVMVDEETIGYKKALVFYEGKPQKSVKTKWIMHEYRVKETERKKESPKTMRLDEWVLCRIHENTTRLTYKRRNNSNDNRSEREVDESLSNGGESSQVADAGESSQTADAGEISQSQTADAGEIGQTVGAAVTILSQGKEEEVMVISENPSPYDYYYSEPSYGDLSLEDMLVDPAHFGMENPVNDDFGNPYLNEFEFDEQPYATSSSWTNNGFQASSSSWINNVEADFPSYSVAPNNATNSQQEQEERQIGAKSTTSKRGKRSTRNVLGIISKRGKS